MRTLSWFSIVRLGLVQMALGSIVVLATSTINRVMIVELVLPAVVPGALIALHYAVQALRPRWGYGSDGGASMTPWIIGGMAMLAAGGALVATAAWLVAINTAAGIALAVLAYLLVGIGAGAAGTTLLVMLAKFVDARRRAPAATIVWIMMIAGFAVTAGTAGHFLDPFSLSRLVAVISIASAIAFVVSVCAIAGLEKQLTAGVTAPAGALHKPPFGEAIRLVWAEPIARRFTIFIFVSMLAYSAQELILEPFAGAVMGLTPGHSTKLTGLQHGGVVAGMILVALIAGRGQGLRLETARYWTSGGCLASALALLFIVFGGAAGDPALFRTSIFLLGVSNGAFAAAAIGSMMALARQGQKSCEGVRMGIWGAAQGIAFGCGGFIGMLSVDIARNVFGAAVPAYSAVFIGEAVLFVFSAAMAMTLSGQVVEEDDFVGVAAE